MLLCSDSDNAGGAWGDAGAAAARQHIYLRQLVLTHYRNYASLKQEFSPGRIVLTGLNGAGKTNLLEAISLLSPGRGLRRAVYADISAAAPPPAGALPQAPHFALSAQLCSSYYGETQIGTGLAQSGESGAEAEKRNSRRVFINGAARAGDALAEYSRIIWLVPAQDGLFTGPAGERRRFVDRMALALDSAHGRRVSDYEKAVRSRNRLLAEGSENSAWLDAIEAQIAALGVAIAAARRDVAARLNAVAPPLLLKGGFPQAELRLEGLAEQKLEEMAAVDAEDFFARLLRAGREEDRRAGRCLSGPHRSDLHILHRQKNMPAALCSTGEQKALLTGIILSHAHLTAELAEMTPILLLDEIAAHLDGKRRAALFSVLEDLQAQAFLTGTDKTLFSALEGKAEFFTVAEGRLERDA